METINEIERVSFKVEGVGRRISRSKRRVRWRLGDGCKNVSSLLALLAHCKGPRFTWKAMYSDISPNSNLTSQLSNR